MKGTIFEKLTNPSQYTGMHKTSARKQPAPKDWNTELKSMTKNQVRHNPTERKKLYNQGRKPARSYEKFDKEEASRYEAASKDRVRHNWQQMQMGNNMRDGRAFEAAVNLAKSSMSIRLDPQMHEWMDALAQVKIRKMHGDKSPWRNSIWQDFSFDKKDTTYNAEDLLGQKDNIEILVHNNVVAGTEHVTRPDLMAIARLAEGVDEAINGLKTKEGEKRQPGIRKRQREVPWPHSSGSADEMCHGTYEFTYREWAYVVRLGSDRQQDMYFRYDPRAPIQEWLDEAEPKDGRKRPSYDSKLWLGMAKDQRKYVTQWQKTLRTYLLRKILV